LIFGFLPSAWDTAEKGILLQGFKKILELFRYYIPFSGRGNLYFLKKSKLKFIFILTFAAARL